MNFKLAALSGKSEDYLASSTKFVALMLTKCLPRTAMGNNDLSKAESTLHESSIVNQQAAYDNKIQKQAVLIQRRKGKRNTAWSHVNLVLNNAVLMYMKND